MTNSQTFYLVILPSMFVVAGVLSFVLMAARDPYDEFDNLLPPTRTERVWRRWPWLFALFVGAIVTMFIGMSFLSTPVKADGTSLAKRYIGTNPTHRRSLWCATFVNMIERKMGRRGTGSDMARSFVNYGRRVSRAQPGDIVVSTRRGGHHVGYFSHYANGRIVLVNGNQNGRVGIAPPPGAVIAIVRP